MSHLSLLWQNQRQADTMAASSAKRRLESVMPSVPKVGKVPHMTNPTKRYSGLAGFDIGTDDDATPSNPPLERSLIDNHELILDCCRYAEGLLSESAVRKKWRLPEDVWEALGSSDELVRTIEGEKVRRVRDGSFKRERAQQHVTRAPDVLAAIMDDPRANARHRVDSVRALDAIATPESQTAAGEEKVIIRIDLGADVRAKGQEPNPADVVIIEATPRPSTPKQIEDDHSEQPSDEWRR